MAKRNKTPEEIAADAARESLKLIEQEAKIRERMNSSYDEFIRAAKEAKTLQETLNRTTKLQEETQKVINSGKRNGVKLTKDELAAEKAKLEYLKKQNELMGKQVDLYKSAAKEANVGAMALGKATSSLLKSTAQFPKMIKNSFGKLKGLGLFEMDKAMKQTALSMGVLSKESGGMRTSITNVAKQTTMIGVNLAKVAKLQEDYSYNLGRNVVLNEKGLIAMSQMSVVTGLGAEGTAQMTADMELIGLSAERTGEFVNQTLKSSHKMGLNASKVMKNLAGNIKLLNRYNFKEGAKGLAKMAETVTKLGVDMEVAAGFADKLWNIEGAVEMSAQLNVMGGAWAQMADPFHLMYMARNDMNGLTEEIANAAKQSVSFNKETGEFDMAAEGMHKLKIIAEQTGLAYDDLVTMGKNAKKFEKIESQISFNIGGGKDGQQIKDFLTSKSMLDKNGEATIMLDGKPKLVKTLKDSDKKLIQAQMKQNEDMEERAKQSRTFDEQLTFFIDNLKVSLLPMLTGLNKMMPKLDGLAEKFNAKGGLGEKIGQIAEKVGDLIGTLGSWVIDNPIKTGLAVLTAKLLPSIMSIGGLFWDTMKWFKNGIALGEGFNTVASGGGGGSGNGGSGGGFSLGRTAKALKGGFKQGGIKGALKAGGKSLFRQGKGVAKGVGSSLKMAGGLGKGMLKGLGKGALKAIPILGSLMSLGEMGVDMFQNGFSWKKLGKGLTNAAVDLIPGVGLVNSVAGGMGYGAGDLLFGGDEPQQVQDGVAKPGRGPFTITDKFGKMAKTHAKDGLEVGPHIGGKVGGGSITHKFDKIDISGVIKLEIPGGGTHNIDLNDEQTRRKITKIVQDGIVKNLGMGKLKG